MQNTSTNKKQKYIILCYIHGYCSRIGSCSTLIGDNESRYLETFMIYCKHGSVSVSIQLCMKSTATVTYHFEQLYQLIVRSL